MIDQTVVVGPFQCNCRILACPETGEAALIDSGDDAPRILKALRELKTAKGQPLQVKWLLHTHAHLDHIGATRDVKLAPEGGASKIALHRDDDELYKNLKMQGQLFGVTYDDPLPVDHFLEDGEEIRLGTLKLSVLHTPGHSPGGICIRLHEDRASGAPETIFSGDTLFRDSIGRTDLWGGDTSQLLTSIKQRLLVLDDSTRVCPGHGPESTIAHEKRANPFLKR